jgi:hypothetical protein
MWKKNKFKETPTILELFYKVGIQGFSQFIDDIQAAHHIHRAYFTKADEAQALPVLDMFESFVPKLFGVN